jgi:hypothetical protein
MKLQDNETFENLMKTNRLSDGDLIHLFWVRPTYVS